MRYLIDGYNLLHFMGLIPRQAGPHSLEKARNALLGLLAGALGDQAGEALVIFDSATAPPDAPRSLDHRGVQAQFAGKDQSADDLIEQLIRNHSAAKKLTVVSNDRRIITAAERRGCRTQNAERFLEFLKRQYRRPPSVLQPDEKTRAGSTDDWLHEFGDIANDPALKELFPFGDFESGPQKGA